MLSFENNKMSPIAYLNGQFVPADDLKINVSDSGFLLGTTVSEKLRTFNGRLFEVDRHFERLSASLQIVGITSVDLEALKNAALSLVQKNYSLLDDGDDLGLTVFVTPGIGMRQGIAQPVVGMHTAPLPFQSWADKYSQGERLIVSSVRQIPSNCWPASLKCRSRMHYFLADREVQAQDSSARALLLDQDDFVAEASTANVLMYCSNEGLVAPCAEKVLSGISVGIVQELAESLNTSFVNRDILPEEFVAAEEVILCSTSPCVLPVVSINSQVVGNGQPGPFFADLLTAWNTRGGLNIADQAVRFRERSPGSGFSG